MLMLGASTKEGMLRPGLGMAADPIFAFGTFYVAFYVAGSDDYLSYRSVYFTLYFCWSITSRCLCMLLLLSFLRIPSQ